MKAFIKQAIENKNVLILGFGREGRACYHLFRDLCPDQVFTIADSNAGILDTYTELKNDSFLKFNLGENYLNNLEDFDLIIKSPGISTFQLNIIVPKEKISSQTDLFIGAYRDQIVGVTGTKGKSTTSSLIYHLLKSSGKKAVLLGNIGIPAFEKVSEIDEETIIVMELSSHQLEHVMHSPKIAILLNLYQEHLDHYESFDHYQLSKLNISKYQKSEDFFIIPSDDSVVKEWIRKFNWNRHYLHFGFNCDIESGICKKGMFYHYHSNNKTSTLFSDNVNSSLKGEHNLRNVMAALMAIEALNIDIQSVLPYLETFEGLPHRIQYVGKFNDIYYFNDSIATIPEATIQAVNALKSVDTLILGGFDRGIDYHLFIDFFKQNPVPNLIFLGKAGDRMMKMLIENGISKETCNKVSSLEEAVILAKKKTQKNGICLLSPAASSYDMFKNFEHRGDRFVELVSED